MKGQILVIDDNPLDVKITVSSIERTGFACYGFTDHKEALEWLKSNTPQLIMLDLQMPTITGYELIPLIKEVPKLSDVPIIIISGKNQTEDVIKAIKLGANDYVVKPLDPLILQEKVDKIGSQTTANYHSVDIPTPEAIAAYISKPICIVSLSEFGMKMSIENRINVGETLEITGLETEKFGTDKVIARCLSCEPFSENCFLIQLTFVGMLESQRQIVRQTCRKLWIRNNRSAA